MPNLTFHDSERGYWWLEVMSRMIYPNDDFKQQEFFAHQHIYSELSKKNPEENANLSVMEVLAILRSPGIKAVQEQGAKNMRKAHIVGYLLYTVMKLENNGEKASWNKAMRITEHFFTNFTDAKSRRVGISEGKFWEYLKIFSSVSHFWAAAHLLQNEKNVIEEAGRISNDTLTESFMGIGIPGNDAELCLFFPIVDKFKDFGTNFTPPNTKEGAPPILDKGKLWLAPQDKIQKGSVELEFSPLETWQTQILVDYNYKG